MARGGMSEPRALETAEIQIGFAIGSLGAPRIRFEDMIDRVEGIVDNIVALIDAQR